MCEEKKDNEKMCEEKKDNEYVKIHWLSRVTNISPNRAKAFRRGLRLNTT